MSAGVLVCLGGGRSARYFLQAARAEGLRTVLFDRAEKPHSLDAADEFLRLGTDEADGIIRELEGRRGLRPAAVLCYSSFPGALRSAALISRRFRLRGFAPEAVDNAYGKRRMKTLLAAAGVGIPAARWVGPGEGPGAARRIPCPCVAKPAEGGVGSAGVRVLNDRGELESFLREGPAPPAGWIFEEFIRGTLLRADGLATDAGWEPLSLCRKETVSAEGVPLTRGYLTMDGQAALGPERLRRIEDTVGRALASLGVVNHFGGADLILDDRGEVHLLEAGFFLDAKMDRLLFHAGVDVYRLLVRHLAGGRIGEAPAARPRPAALRFLFPDRPGRLRKEERAGEGTAAADAKVEWELEDGSVVSFPPRSISGILGWAVATGDSSDDAWERCGRAQARSLYRIEG